MQMNGIQINTKFGMNFNTQYSVQDTGLTQNTTLANSTPLYNLHQVKFDGKQTDNISGYNQNDLFLVNGLKQNPVKKGWIG